VSAGFQRLPAAERLNGMTGRTLDVSVHELRDAAALAFEAPGPGEEIGAVLAGRLDVEADDERYTLEAGQVIVIPAGMARRYVARTPRATLYRVVVAKVREDAQ